MNATEKKLIKQAKEKGFKIGVEFYSAYSLNISKVEKGIFEYEKDDLFEILYLDNNAVFCNGKWSQIIEPVKTENEILNALKLMADYYIHEKPLEDLELECLHELVTKTIKKHEM